MSANGLLYNQRVEVPTRSGKATVQIVRSPFGARIVVNNVTQSTLDDWYGSGQIQGVDRIVISMPRVGRTRVGVRSELRPDPRFEVSSRLKVQSGTDCTQSLIPEIKNILKKSKTAFMSLHNRTGIAEEHDNHVRRILREGNDALTSSLATRNKPEKMPLSYNGRADWKPRVRKVKSIVNFVLGD